MRGFVIPIYKTIRGLKGYVAIIGAKDSGKYSAFVFLEHLGMLENLENMQAIPYSFEGKKIYNRISSKPIAFEFYYFGD